MNFYSPSVAINLTLNLEDGATGLFPQATVFSNGTLEATVNLAHVGSGRYSGVWTPGATPKTYDALFIVYADVGHTIESLTYVRVQEKWQTDVWDEALAAHAIVGSAGEFLARLTAARAANIDDSNVRTRLIEKILRNRLALADGSVGNWVLYDDDSVTPLLTFNVTDKTGVAIFQPSLAPSRRSRGV